MCTTERKLAEMHGAQKVAQMFANGIIESNISFVDGVYWKDDCDKPVVITINATSGQRSAGSGTVQERDFNDLLLLRARIAGRLQEGCHEVSILYKCGMVSVPENGEDKIATLVEGYERIPLGSTN